MTSSLALAIVLLDLVEDSGHVQLAHRHVMNAMMGLFLACNSHRYLSFFGRAYDIFIAAVM